MLEPKIPIKRKLPLMKKCSKCEQTKNADSFIAVKSWYYADGLAPICNDCIKEQLIADNWDWGVIDKLCQTMDIPFIPREFERLKDINGENVFPIYAKFVMSAEYERFGWEDYFKKYQELKAKAKLDMELPYISDSYYEDLKIRWGHNYDNEQLVYLENLYNGLLATQNVNGALQMDQAQKLCKISLTIDERIMGGVDFDKLMGSYEKLTKVADFTPKNARSDSDFSSMGEIVAWEEKRGWLNKWYDGANKDIVDEVIHSMQAFVQRLYTNEAGIGDEVTERIQQLKIAAELDKKDSDLEQKRFMDDPFFDIDEVDLEQHDNNAYEELIIDDVLDSDTAQV